MSASQKKMIAALEADLERVQCELDEAEQALISERQRREQAETVLSRYTGTDIPGSGAASDYFAKYEPGK